MPEAHESPSEPRRDPQGQVGLPMSPGSGAGPEQGSGMPPAAAMYRLGGRTYPAVVVRGCQVCHNPLRAMIETHLVTGRSFAAIARSLPPWAGVTPSAISRHARNGHLPLAEDVRRQIVVDRSNELGRDPESHEGEMGDYLSFLRLGVADTTERLVRREIEPTISEGIAMAKILAALGVHEADGQAEADERLELQTRALRAILATVRSMLDDASYREFSMRVLADPDVASLLGPVDAAPTPPAPRSSDVPDFSGPSISPASLV